ncbi:hypothetical protein R1sor_013244 [Riccia sorocarpa]|uniref:EF-hand domain-containing protein n=1 Tax=Riccia sorocarpa TaxID=122646 RepID=A0ABD3H997_9MARC
MNFAEIKAKLPSDKTPEEKAARSKLFKQFDPNGNGYLSLSEVDKGIRDVLGLEELFEAKPAIIRAFNAAKSAGKSKSKLGDDFVERSEFRLILLYLRQYFELFEMFETVDTSNDRKISREEFDSGLDKLKNWGLTVSDPEASFNQIDTNQGGSILFAEFADWALKSKIDFEDLDEDPLRERSWE